MGGNNGITVLLVPLTFIISKCHAFNSIVHLNDLILIRTRFDLPHLQMENTVDKSARLLTEWRQTEGKMKKTSHAAARENEKLQDALLDVRCVINYV